MIDPVSAAITGMKGIGAAAGAASAYLLARKRFRYLGTFDPEWLSVTADGDEELGLTQTQAHDIQAFLSSRQMEPVLAFFAISKLSADSSTEEICNTTIANEASRWIAESGCWASLGVTTMGGDSSARVPMGWSAWGMT
jgi:hypothetical protein